MTAPLLELDNVTVHRSDNGVFSHLNLVLNSGENVAILGPNGCGKSTLVKLITRELFPLAGSGPCSVFGRMRWNVWELRSSLGIVTNDLQLAMDPSLTSIEVVLSGFSGHTGLAWKDEITGEMISSAGAALGEVDADSLADRRFATLSSGEARRVMIARALAHRPHTLLFDEPTTSLDIVAANDLMTTIRRLCSNGVNLLLVTHHFEEIIPEISRIVIFRRGQVFADGARESIMRSELISAAFGREVTVEGTGPYRIQIGKVQSTTRELVYQGVEC